MKDTDKVTMTVKQLRKLVKESSTGCNISTEEVKKDLDKRVDELFYDFQGKFGIQYGDIPPDEMFELDEKISDLAELLARILQLQCEGNF